MKDFKYKRLTEQEYDRIKGFRQLTGESNWRFQKSIIVGFKDVFGKKIGRGSVKRVRQSANLNDYHNTGVGNWFRDKFGDGV